MILLLVVAQAWHWWKRGRVKAASVRTVGRVLDMRSESGTSYGPSPYSPGGASYTPYAFHTMSYEFDVEGRAWGPFKKGVGGSLANKKAGDEIIVYYLPENPQEHTIE